MNKHSIPLFIGVVISIIVVLLINNFTVVDDCLDHGGSFDYKAGQCVLETGEIHVASFTNYLIAIYFIIAIAVAFTVSRLIKRFLTGKT
ncbi:hypothetical protein [Litorilituus lipolyticus]|uniref:Uncharacterized protein n=1 Tax=Litorilituus lipolyticus TaxID=2491017 RepID=A0A502KWH0_9GAMM|nr:hypothetical protein [Litorilituus lipolyticus]TPH16090.1 hypothetical protein EPA86_07300 [Litorilituus lipolyticus]